MNTITISLTGKIIKFKFRGTLYVFAWGKEIAPTVITPVATGTNDTDKK